MKHTYNPKDLHENWSYCNKNLSCGGYLNLEVCKKLQQEGRCGKYPEAGKQTMGALGNAPLKDQKTRLPSQAVSSKTTPNNVEEPKQ